MSWEGWDQNASHPFGCRCVDCNGFGIDLNPLPHQITPKSLGEGVTDVS